VQWHAKHGLVLMAAELALLLGLSIVMQLLMVITFGVGCLASIGIVFIWAGVLEDRAFMSAHAPALAGVASTSWLPAGKPSDELRTYRAEYAKAFPAIPVGFGDSSFVLGYHDSVEALVQAFEVAEGLSKRRNGVGNDRSCGGECREDGHKAVGRGNARKTESGDHWDSSRDCSINSSQLAAPTQGQGCTGPG